MRIFQWMKKKAPAPIQDNQSQDIQREAGHIGHFFSGRSKNRGDDRVDPAQFVTRFDAMLAQKTHGSLIVGFPINHYYTPSRAMDRVDGIDDEQFANHFPEVKTIQSMLKIKITLQEGQLFLQMSALGHPDFIDYQFEDFVNGLLQKTQSPFAKLVNPHVVSNVYTETIHARNHQFVLAAHRLSIGDDLAFDGVNILDLIQTVTDFNTNCLNRFAELAHSLDEMFYELSQELDCTLAHITANYKKIHDSEYQLALEQLTSIEQSDIFRNDPLIRMSLTPCRAALEALRESARLSSLGIKIRAQDLNVLFQELTSHAGDKPSNKCWLPQESLTDFIKLVELFLTSGVSEEQAVAVSNAI